MKLFTRAYFFYKQYIEDPYFNFVKQNKKIFEAGCVLDVGANIGYTSWVFANAFADDSQCVYAFEPETHNFQMLCETIKNYGLNQRVIPIKSAVGDRQGRIGLRRNLLNHADHRVVASDNKNVDEEVAITSIDAFCQDRDWKVPISFIKIDVQGYELPVCRGMNQTLARNPQAVIALEYAPAIMREQGFDAHEMISFFIERDYRIYQLEQNGNLRGVSTTDLNTIVLPRRGYCELVFLPRQHAT